jgi:hypothetical protein
VDVSGGRAVFIWRTNVHASDHNPFATLRWSPRSCDSGGSGDRAARGQLLGMALSLELFQTLERPTPSGRQGRREEVQRQPLVAAEETRRSHRETQADTLAALHAAGGKVLRAWAMKEMVRAIFAPSARSSGRPHRRRRRPADRPAPGRPVLQPPETVRATRTHDPQHRPRPPAARRLKLINARAEAMNNMNSARSS